MLQTLVAAALKAGDAILEVYARPDFAARVKSDGSPVTEADARAEAVILAALKAAYPDIPVVAEEQAAAGETPSVGARFFLVDPLDGTKEFLNRNGDFTVNIGLIEDEEPTAGVVYAPAYGDVFFGQKGEGAKRAKYADGRLSAWSDIAVRKPAEALDVVASRSHRGNRLDGFFEQLPAGVQFLGFLNANPKLIGLLGRLLGVTPVLADALARTPDLFDVLLDPEAFAPLPPAEPPPAGAPLP